MHATSTTAPRGVDWDIFCRVVDNLGDIGVCWRLAADLAARDASVRLWVDDASALAWMAPGGRRGVEIRPWPAEGIAEPLDAEPAPIVVETFGAGLPPGFVARMAARRSLWINLEHLSAEAYVERCHRLPSPRPDGQVTWFYYPGFTPATGGLLREPGLLARMDGLVRARWLREHAGGAREGERVVSLFCYDNPSLPALLDQLATRPTLLLATAGAPAAQVERLLGPTLARGALRAVLLPHLPQPVFDEMLAAADLNFVRGEDSFVRAMWAGRPFVWQAYVQDDGAHADKVEAFLDRLLGPQPAPQAGADSVADTGREAGSGPKSAPFPTTAASVRAVWRGLNGIAPLPANDWTPAPFAGDTHRGADGAVDPPDAGGWPALFRRWRQALSAQPDLVTQLMRWRDAAASHTPAPRRREYHSKIAGFAVPGRPSGSTGSIAWLNTPAKKPHRKSWRR